MVRILQSPWVALVVAMLSYLGSTIALWPKFQPVRPVAEVQEEETGPNVDASWNFRSEEIQQLITELKQEKEALVLKEQQLNELSLRLQNERTELNQITQKVFQMQREFDTNVVRVREEEIPNLKKLVKIYAAMTPEAAANVLKEMDEERIVKILAFMKEGETAPILEAFAKGGENDNRRAALISDRLRLSVTRTAPAKKSN